MLILRRKSGESIVIGDKVTVTVLDINEGSVRLAIDAPKAISILRSELLQAADTNRDSVVAEHPPSRDLLRLLEGKRGKERPGAPRRPRPRPVKPGAAEQALPADSDAPKQ
ncbi:MAG: carbon storage regulator CsrA [Oscillibacter sp.]|nr:carbon storage regulator CsrA [Oscillibacter sp.]